MSLNTYTDFSNMARHLNNHILPHLLAQPSHLAYTGEVSWTPAADPVVLKISKLTRPMITVAMAVSTTTTTKIIEKANRRWGIKLLPENVQICSKPNSLAPKTPNGRRNFLP
jgi:hypothetical protein